MFGLEFIVSVKYTERRIPKTTIQPLSDVAHTPKTNMAH